jgi:ATP synthase subunit 6
MNSPLEQFKIRKIEESIITNQLIYILIGGVILYIVLRRKEGEKRIREIIVGEIIKRITEVIIGIIPKPLGSSYIALGSYLFIIISIYNLIGLVPNSWTVTSHIIITITLSLSIIIGVTIRGIEKHSLKGFLSLFKPEGLDNMKLIIPLIFFIELLSYLIRIISLAVRLTANMLSGHTLIAIITSFLPSFSFSPLMVITLLPLILLSAIYLLELAVALIQSYVFTLLTLTYIKDGELLH